MKKIKKKHLPCVTKTELIFRDAKNMADFKQTMHSCSVMIGSDQSKSMALKRANIYAQGLVAQGRAKWVMD
ncbi:MAG: hypothetical protein HON51_07705 [Gammaproteobacteria bacterium]|jgi:hypothetical protein|nr:hypothetical protein [Gammaproteobacteria bacterium]MBT5222616.1 hypothetical protein [Gammaproteobacteria bacterium]MBT5824961.1 hypothetical protein [Gammaproteobacteria bacterium]MBT5966662.1 hypothetical protein [Gammaproteobacteria bacterium]MBT6420470.1 hypothetical protein [Gammaproteobacteria bacterium]